MSIAPPTAAILPQADWRRRLPPLFVCLLAGFFIGLVILVQQCSSQLEEAVPFVDGAVVNILSLIFSFFAFVTLHIWFVWWSTFSFGTRRLGLVIPWVLAAVCLVAFRYEGVDGYMKPIFVPRWRQRHEDSLMVNLPRPQAESPPASGETPAAAPSPPTVDLRTETPADFPQFLGPQRNNYLPEAKLADDWQSSPPRKVWMRDIGPGWSGFAVRNGYAVTIEQRGSDEWVTCYDLSNGELRWHHAAPGRHDEALGGLGPRATPTIDGGLVYVQGATGLVRCIDGATGLLVWQDDLLERYGLTQVDSESAVKWGRAGSALIVGDLVIFPAGGKGANIRSLIAYHKQTGQVAWELGDDQISYTSPVLATLGGTPQLVYVSEQKVAGYELVSGKQLWQFARPGHSNADANVSQGIVLPGDRILVSKSYGTGGALLQIKADGDNWSAEPLWENHRVLKTKYTNAVVIADAAYALSDGVLECVDLETGKQKWRGGRYGHGQLLGAGDKLLVLGEDGDLMLVAADPAKFRQLGKIEALPGITWNNLCLSGQLLLIRNGKQAVCYELP